MNLGGLNIDPFRTRQPADKETHPPQPKRSAAGKLKARRKDMEKGKHDIRYAAKTRD